jgi:excisionase family DNA binding protein
MDGDLLTVAEVADLLRTSDRTLRRWREEGIGPAYVRIGARYIRYRRSSVMAWLEAQEREREKEDQS